MSRDLDLGFIALTDSAPLVVARERGLFADEGLNVTLRREVSWATIRDKVVTGLYQGAHMLAPMLLAESLAADTLIAPASLNAHGASVGVSRALADAMAAQTPDHPLSAGALAAVIAQRRQSGAPDLSFAVVFPHSMHNYILRYWLASAGIDPDHDIRVVIAAPTAVAARLKSGEIDGFCVGAPWPGLCEAESGARITIESGTFWPGGPDKVLGLSKPWAGREPETALALTRAVLRASLWADMPENRQALAEMLAQPAFIAAPAELIARNLGAGANALRFSRYATSFPWRSHAAWIVSQMVRWGQIDPATDLERALKAYRPEIFRAAAEAVGIPAPLADEKIEGAHTAEWAVAGTSGPILMARDSFFEGAPFEAKSVLEYAASFAISRYRR